MTPMIDVVFLLLIFFVCASIGREADRLLPTPLSGGAVAADEIVVPIDRPIEDLWIEVSRRDNRTVAVVQGRVHEDVASLEATLETLGELTPSTPVILDVADDVPMQDVLRIFDAGRDAGFRSVQFAADPQ